MKLLSVIALGLAYAVYDTAAHAAQTETQSHDNLTFIEVPPLQAPVLEGGRIYRQVRLNVRLETRPGKNEELTRSMMPRLQTVYQSTFLEIVRNRIQPRKAPDIAYIAEELQAVTDDVLGSGIALIRIDNVSIIH